MYLITPFAEFMPNLEVELLETNLRQNSSQVGSIFPTQLSDGTSCSAMLLTWQKVLYPRALSSIKAQAAFGDRRKFYTCTTESTKVCVRLRFVDFGLP